MHLFDFFFPVLFSNTTNVFPATSFHTQTFAYPESTAEREEILQGLQGRIEDINSVSGVNPRAHSADYTTQTFQKAVGYKTLSFHFPIFVFPGVESNRNVPAAAAGASCGRPARVEGESPEVQGHPDGSEPLQSLCDRQMPDRRGLVSQCQAAGAAECPQRRRGEEDAAATTVTVGRVV